MQRRINRRHLLAAAPALGAALAAGSAWATRGASDLVLVNGRAFTGDPTQRWAEAVAVRHGLIVHVGAASDVLAMRGPRTREIDLGGRLLIPAFADPHCHNYDYAVNLFGLKIGPSHYAPEHNLETYSRIILDYRTQHPGLRQLRADGYDPWILPAIARSQRRMPRDLLDELVPDIPAAILSRTGHHVWVNSRTLALTGLTRDSPEPSSGAYIRDPFTGDLNGIFEESPVIDFILNRLPEPAYTPQQMRTALLAFERDIAFPNGVVSLLSPTSETAPVLFDSMQRLSDEGRLVARYNVAQWANELRGLEQLPELIATRRRIRGGPRFKLNTIKLYSTGTVDGVNGVIVWPGDSLNQTFAALDRNGFRIFVHNVGPTESYAATLDAFEYALNQNGPRDSRHVITHVRAEAAPLAERFRSLGVRADADWHPAPKAFYDAGVLSSISTDWPTARETSMLPRISEGVKAGVPLEAMIASATLRGAETLFAENETGSIEVGKAADLVVLDRDLFNISADEIAAARPVLTLASGSEVYRHSSF